MSENTGASEDRNESGVNQAGHININIGGRETRVSLEDIVGGDQYKVDGRGTINTAKGDLYIIKGNYVVHAETDQQIPLQLPSRPEQFTGRGELVADLKRGLVAGCAVSICAIGGMGKTAVASEALHQLTDEQLILDRFPDGVLFFSFYGTLQADKALEHIVRSYGVDTRQSLTSAVRQALSGREALIVLDGCEEADDLARVTDELNRCGVLVTSRKRTDRQRVHYDLARLSAAEAEQLVRNGAGEWAADEVATAALCVRLGHWPIALRLAARYMQAMGETAAEYDTWLQENLFEALVLDEGERGRDNIALLLRRSVAQLSETGGKVLQIGGLLALRPFGRGVVQAVLAGEYAAWRQGLNQAVNYGLLVKSGREYEVSHPLVYGYAREMVAGEKGLTAEVARFYVRLIKETELKAESLQVLDGQKEHVLAVGRGCHAAECWELLSDLAFAVSHWFSLRGHYREWVGLGMLGVTAAKQLGQRQREGAHYGNLGLACHNLGEMRKGIARYEQALFITREVGDRRGEGNHLVNLGNAYSHLGETGKAIDRYGQALLISREIGDRHGEEAYLGNLGNAYNDLGEVRKGIGYYEQALVIARETGDFRGEGNWLGNLGSSYSKLGEARQATNYYEQALAAARKIGDRRGEGYWLGSLGDDYRDLGEVSRAIDLYKQALLISQEIGDRRVSGRLVGKLGNACHNLGDYRQAIDDYEQALLIAREIGDRRGEGAHLGNLGLAYQDLGQFRQAINHYEQAATIQKYIGDVMGTAFQYANLGMAYKQLGEMDRVLPLWNEALAIFTGIGSSRAAMIERWLAQLDE